jgi:hypothetical protein
MVTQVLLNVAVLSLQAQSSEFKLQFYQKKKKGINVAVLL